jgi:flagellar biosynthesis/type III secretory pathway chaperone
MIGGRATGATKSQSRAEHKPNPRPRKGPVDKPHEDLTSIMEQLISTVAEEAEHFERLLALLRRQQESLIRDDIRRIEATTLEQKNALRRSRVLERRRQKLVSAITENGHGRGSAGRTNIVHIVASVSADYGNRLSQIHTSMKKSIERLRETKEQNRMLIQQSLGNIEEFKHLISALKTPPQVHTPERVESRSVTPHTRIGMRQPWRRGPWAC